MNLYNGKGDRPRNIFSKNFRENFDRIAWGTKRKPTKVGRSKKVYVYKPSPKD